jgi:hypothetical protein
MGTLNEVRMPSLNDKLLAKEETPTIKVKKTKKVVLGAKKKGNK